MSDRIVLTAADGSSGRMLYADGEIYGPLPPVEQAHRTIYDRLVVAGVKVEPFVEQPPAAPDSPTLSDWRVALTLWGRIDDVTGRVAALAGSSDPQQAMLGKVAKERLEYANNVLRAQLLTLKDALGFTAADVDESLWRADRVRQGDLSGVWPLPAKAG